MVKWSRYRPGVAQRVGRGIALLFHDRGTRRGWVVSSTPRLHFTPGIDPVPIVQEAGWAPGPVWIGGKSRPHRDSIPDRPARSQSLYWLSYRAHPVYSTDKKHQYLRATAIVIGNESSVQGNIFMPVKVFGKNFHLYCVVNTQTARLWPMEYTCQTITTKKYSCFRPLPPRHGIIGPFLGTLAKLRKATLSSVVFVRPSARMEQLGFHWTDFHEI